MKIMVYCVDCAETLYVDWNVDDQELEPNECPFCTGTLLVPVVPCVICAAPTLSVVLDEGRCPECVKLMSE